MISRFIVTQKGSSALSSDVYKNYLESAFAAEHLALLGIVKLQEEEDYARFASWLAAKKNAGMDYLANYPDMRRDPRRIFAGAQSAIVFALPYYQGDTWTRHVDRPRVAQYARLKDYHKIMWRKGEKVAAGLTELAKRSGGGDTTYRVCVDSFPLLERALAARTSFGFIGKNTMFIHPRQGSFMLLGEIISSLPLAADAKPKVDPTNRAELGGCGSCQRCQINCPTGALNEAYQLDANRCLAYWTIEHRGTIPEEFWPWLRFYYFGCDICQLVCPYNRHKTPASAVEALRTDMKQSLFEVAVMSAVEYETWFGGTPLTRAKRHGLRRNALIALTVTGNERLAEALAHVTADDHEVLQQTVAQIRRYSPSVNPR